ncbi:MAG TPA: Ig-like domain-containing protein [Longimicrobiaceae bacterium]
MSRLAAFCLTLVLQSACTDSKGPTAPDEEPGAPTVASVTVNGPAQPLRVGETAQLTAVVRDSEGNVMAQPALQWTSADPEVATVSGTGLATALAPGEATIRATAGGRADSVALAVQAPPPAAERGSIAYVRDDEIRLIQPDGSGDRLLWTLPDTLYRISGLSWRPDGSELAFASNHEMAVSFYERDIFAIRPDGSGLRKLTNAPVHADLASLPQGGVTVTVTNFTFGGGPFFVYVVGADAPQSVIVGPGASKKVTFAKVADLGDGVHQPAVVISGIQRWWNAATGADVKPGATLDAGAITISANPIEHFGADAPFWSADGSELGYIGTPTCLLGRVPSHPTPGPTYDPLVDPEVWESVCAVDWAPTPGLADPLLIADMSDYVETGETHIHRVPAGSDSRTQPVTTFDDYVRIIDMRWIPDGSGFLVARQDGLLDEDINLYEYTFATGALRKVTDIEGGFVRSFSVAPDGVSIAFERIDGGSIYDLTSLPSDLWVMRRDGTEARRLVAGGRLPAW